MLIIENIDKSGRQQKFLDTGKIIIDFYGESCGPCKIMEPVFEQLDLEFDDIKFVKCDVALNDLSSKYNVRAVPTFVIMKDGEVIHQTAGIQTKDTLRKCLKTL